jgi:DNA processing protein
MNDTAIKYWVGFSLIPGIGKVKFTQLESYFGSLKDAWVASPAELKRAGLDRNSVNAITAHRDRIDPSAEVEKLDRHGVRALTLHDPYYPPRLD